MRWPVVMVLSVLAVAALPRPADACPCCGPCSKYDKLREPKPSPVFDVYVRERAAPLPRGARRGRVMALLTGSRWIPRRPARTGAPRVRLFDASNVPDRVTRRGDERSGFVHELVLRNGRFELQLDGIWYQVSPCRDDGRATTCLARVAD